MIIDDHMKARPLLEQMAVGFSEHIEKQQAIIDLAVRMRDAQKRYYRNANHPNLIAAKQLEVEFDKATSGQGDLLGGSDGENT